MKFEFIGKLHSKPTLIFLAPMLAYLLIWRIFPLLYTVSLSFHDWNMVRQTSPSFVGFSNYHDLLLDSRFHHSLYISLIFMVVGTGLEVVIGTSMAIATDRTLKGKGFIQGVLIVPMILTPVAVGTIWHILYEPTIGPINYFLEILRLTPINWLGSTSTALWAIVIADIWEWTPFIYVLVLSGLQTIPKTIVEAAEIDGASGFDIVRLITLPLLKGTIAVAALLRAMDAFRVFPKIYVMTGGGPARSTESVSILIYKTAFRFFEMGYGASMIIIVLLLLIIIYGSYLRMVRV